MESQDHNFTENKPLTKITEQPYIIERNKVSSTFLLPTDILIKIASYLLSKDIVAFFLGIGPAFSFKKDRIKNIKASMQQAAEAAIETQFPEAWKTFNAPPEIEPSSQENPPEKTAENLDKKEKDWNFELFYLEKLEEKKINVSECLQLLSEQEITYIKNLALEDKQQKILENKEDQSILSCENEIFSLKNSLASFSDTVAQSAHKKLEALCTQIEEKKNELRIACAIKYLLPAEEITQMIAQHNRSKYAYACSVGIYPFNKEDETKKNEMLERFQWKAWKAGHVELMKKVEIFYSPFSIVNQEKIKRFSKKHNVSLSFLTPLHCALIKGNVRRLEEFNKVFLLELSMLKGLPPSIINDKENLFFLKEGDNLSTFLHFAAQVSNLKSIAFLVEKGLHIFEKNAKNETPFSLAAARGRLDVIRYFYEKATPPKALLTETLLFLLKDCKINCKAENMAVIQFLLDKGADFRFILKESNSWVNPSHPDSKIIKNFFEAYSLKKRLLSKKLNKVFITASIEKEKNAFSENIGIYEDTAYLFDAFAMETSLFNYNEKTFAKTIAENLREKATSEPSGNNIINCWQIIEEKKNLYEISHGTLKEGGTLAALTYYLKNKATKPQNKIENDWLPSLKKNKTTIINNIEVYLKERKFNDPFTQFKMYFFGNDSGQGRAIVYKKLLQNAKSPEEFYFILNALFQSNGETLKRYITENRHFALSALKPKEIKFLKKHLRAKFPKIKNIDPHCPGKMSFSQKEILAMQKALSEALEKLKKDSKDCGYLCAATSNNLNYFIQTFRTKHSEYERLSSDFVKNNFPGTLTKQLADAIEQGRCSKSYVIKNILREIRQPASNTLTI